MEIRVKNLFGWGFSLAGVALLCAAVATGCGPKSTNGGGNNDNGNTNDNNNMNGNPDASVTDGSPLADGSGSDSGNPYLIDGGQDLDGCPPSMQIPCPNPIPMGCGPTETCGNGLDDDCNGQVDEGCTCVTGEVQPCFYGPPARVDVGACTRGTQTCQGGGEFAVWGSCVGGMWPSAEVCDALDNDCNGCVDDGLCCDPDIFCPDPTQIPDGHPFVPYPLDGTQYYSGPANSWSWTVEGGPCDVLLGNTSFTITGGNTATPTIDFTLSGDYTVTMEVVTPNGTYTCVFVVHVIGPGLRIELCWEGTGSRDIDLHLLREDFGVPWCTDNGVGALNDCYYMNCKATNWEQSGWGYAASPIAECVGGPEGTWWQSLHGDCKNPRLDVDNIFTPGIPENINVDLPDDGEMFRIMVHYYSGSGEAHPMVNIYCDGHRVATYGQVPDLVTGYTSSGGFGCQGHSWRVADVLTHVNGGITTCDVTPLHPINQPTGYRVLNNDTTY